MAPVVRAFPLLPGKKSALLAFLAELAARKTEANSFYRQYGVTRESAHLQTGSGGELLIVCTDLADADSAARAYAAQTASFDAWFKARVLEFSGIDPNKHPLGPECASVSIGETQERAGQLQPQFVLDVAGPSADV